LGTGDAAQQVGDLRCGGRGPLMPRLAGQVDRAKAEAMLVAAGQVIAERGFGAPLEAIAKRAGVSKQTLYNHYGGKAGLIRALIRRRVDEMTAPLAEPQAEPRTEATLAAFALGLMQTLLSPTNIALTRVVIQGAADMPDIAQAMHEAGAMATRARLAQFLQAETAAGRLCVDDAPEAAELFSGMVGARQLPGLLGLDPGADAQAMARLSASIARRFVRAYGGGR
jgi:TetR/AcrR family transcriptional regulator, mexJK operon transcriptional repressor